MKWLDNINDKFTFSVAGYDIEPKDLAIGAGAMLMTGGLAAPLLYAGYDITKQNQSQKFQQGAQFGAQQSELIEELAGEAVAQADQQRRSDTGKFVYVAIGSIAVVFIIIMLVYLNKMKK